VGSEKGKHKDGLIVLIGSFKLLKSLMLIGVALGLFKLLNKDLGTTVSHWAQTLNVDPDSKYFKALFGKLLNLSPKLPLVAIGMLCYAVLFGIEGIGLLLKKRWGEYLTVIITGSFLPLETYEMIKHATVIKGFVIAINLAIFIYLIIRLRKNRAR
jgi:uncharacterized membrane protein (DUF2068 family)